MLIPMGIIFNADGIIAIINKSRHQLCITFGLQPCSNPFCITPHITSCRVVSYRIISYHTISYHIASHRICGRWATGGPDKDK